MIPRTTRIKVQYIGACLLITALAGCGDFFATTPTELESKAVIRDISRVLENPHVGNPLPAVYLEEPKRLVSEDGVRLFYFTKYNPAGNLAFVDKDKKNEKKIHGFGGTIRDLGFQVSSNPNTNQLIIHCADNAECDKVLAYLEKTDVPPIQIHIDCIIMERFGDVTKDWEATLLIENLFGEQITLGSSKFPEPAFPGAALRESRRADFGLDIGYWMNKGISGHQVRVAVDMLESRGYLKVLMNPILETVNGKQATVEIIDNAPIEKVVTERGNLSYVVTDYKEVIDRVTVTPYVYSDGSIGLKTDITIGSKSKPEGVVQAPIITERSISIGENRIEPGKSLVIGGMRKGENRSVVRGVPFFKDLPIIGILFSSKDYEENATEIVFALTPSISLGGVEYREMAEMVREKFEMPDYQSDIDELVTDPLGTETYSDVVGKRADQAEAEMIRLQMEAAEANRQAMTEQLRGEKAMTEAAALRARAKEAEALIVKSQAEKKAAEAEKQAAAKEAEAQKAKLTQAQAEIEEAQAAAAATRAEAQKAQADLKEAEQKVQTFTEEEEKARDKAQQIQQQIDALENQPPPEAKAPPAEETQAEAASAKEPQPEVSPVEETPPATGS